MKTKTSNLKKLLTKLTFASVGILTTTVSTAALAQAGTNSGGGGDIQCDAQIKDIVSNIEDWLNNKGPEAGNFKLDLSSSLNPVTGLPFTYADYEKAMLLKLQLPLNVSCVSKGDPEYPVDVDDSTKICKTTPAGEGLNMVCNRDLFIGTKIKIGLNVDERIEQIHHEFAILVPGLEPDYGPLSTYKISRQLSGSTGDELVHKLVIKSSSNPCSTTPTGQTLCSQGGNDLSVRYISAAKLGDDRQLYFYFNQTDSSCTSIVSISWAGFNDLAQVKGMQNQVIAVPVPDQMIKNQMSHQQLNVTWPTMCNHTAQVEIYASYTRDGVFYSLGTLAQAMDPARPDDGQVWLPDFSMEK